MTGVVTAHRLASLIEVIHAKDRAALRRSQKHGPPAKWEDEYDPLAATCLADLIYRTMCTGEKEGQDG